jgi:DNA replication ATP-dependent helicase Dna2
MPAFSKKVFSLFLRTRCQKQLLLYLYNDGERKTLGMPPRQQTRSGMGSAAEVGYEWQDEKVNELADIFGNENIIINSVPEKGRPGKLELIDCLNEDIKPFQFIVEACYDANTPPFRDAIGFNDLTDINGQSVIIGRANPDIIQILPSRSAGSLPFQKSKIEYDLAIAPNGDLWNIPEEDTRFRLRIIDIKLASEPGANYFAEVVYYSMTLSAWLQENNLAHKYLVVATPAVWPGSYTASNLSIQSEAWRRIGHQPASIELSSALELDIEIAAVDVYVPRLLRLLSEQLPSIINTSWDQLPYHVNHSCQGCEFLGYPWLNKNGDTNNDEKHCWPTAERCSHLSMVAGLSSGAALQLSTRGAINDITALANADTKTAAFTEHQMLRAKGIIYPHRAQSLNSGIASVIPDSGGDALMPRWPDLRFYIFVDYDLSSAITVSFGLRAHWREPIPYGSMLTKQSKNWNEKEGAQEVFLVDRRDTNDECRELLKFLRAIKKIMDEVIQMDSKNTAEGRRDLKTTSSTYQIYLWDEAQKRHLIRLVSRHLAAILSDKELRNLAWLFPPPELLADSETSSRKSPLTIVSSVIQNTIAAPVPHHLTLLGIVRTYRNTAFRAPSVHPLYSEPLTDLIPSERIYEYWNKHGDYNKTGNTIAETSKQKLFALGSITSRVESDLKNFLANTRLAAPQLVKPPRNPIKLSPQGHLLHEFVLLNAALQALETHTIQAMPSREREARFKSAILLQRLEGQERQDAIESLQKTAGRVFPLSNQLSLYKLSPSSSDFNARDGAIGFALSPLNEPGFLDQSSSQLLMAANMQPRKNNPTIAEYGLTEVSIVAIDRVNCLIALNPGRSNEIVRLETAGELDFSEGAILDPVSKDFLSKKVKLTLETIGYPASAKDDRRVLEALGQRVSSRGRITPESPASIILWQAPTLDGKKIDRDTVALRKQLEESNFHLNDSQWQAWEQSLTRQLTLIWGPPGTGKSWTLCNIILAAVKDAVLREKPLRFLITAGTYTAIDNVILSVDGMLSKLLPEKPYSIFRLQSTSRPTSDRLANEHPDIVDIAFEKNNGSQEIIDLMNELSNPSSITIVGVTPQQLHNLACFQTDAKKNIRREWFDFVVLDEASQLDVATSTLIFTKISSNGSLILAGDDLQLPPVHQAEAPEDLEHLVGSIYNYFRQQHNIEPQPLQINYRSNKTIVEFTKLAGYDPGLSSHSQNLSIRFLTPIPSICPDSWPRNIFWTPAWSQMLNPNHPTTCFIYEDELSSQVNDFEADAITALILLLYGRIMKDLANKKEHDHSTTQTTNNLHNEASFWESAVGIVTPHRAQQSKIVQRLQSAFPTHPADKIRDAVDTVERFQGQERQVIFASFGLGDPDMIQSEDEFLYSLNRFNVLASRAQAKLIVFTTRTLVDHLSNDSGVLQQSRLLKRYAEIFCNQAVSTDLGYFRDGELVERPGIMKYHSSI